MVTDELPVIDIKYADVIQWLYNLPGGEVVHEGGPTVICQRCLFATYLQEIYQVYPNLEVALNTVCFTPKSDVEIMAKLPQWVVYAIDVVDFAESPSIEDALTASEAIKVLQGLEDKGE